MNVYELPTPALVVDAAALDHNLATMAQALPGPRLRPHVKAHKSSALAARQAAAQGHGGFTAATIKECEVLASAGLGDDILLANEVVHAERLGRLMSDGRARVTLAVDSPETIDAAVQGGVGEVVIDVNVGLPRCGCQPEQAGSLADVARSRGLDVRGVMGYEGHAVGLEDRAERADKTEAAMALLLQAHAEVGGDLVSAGGTGTYALNIWATEIQAGTYALMDTAYDKLGLPFRPAVWVFATVIASTPKWAVADCGLKAFGMDHGNPAVEGIDGAKVWFLSDEHITFSADRLPAVGQRIRVTPAHLDPTLAYHERMHVVDGLIGSEVGGEVDGEVVETWPIDMRGW
jgi:D-serine deaminase-like pyridoxal phosphate-dependent protein